MVENNQFFAVFDANRAKIWPKCPLNLTFLAITARNVHSGVLQTLCFALQGIPQVNMKKT